MTKTFRTAVAGVALFAAAGMGTAASAQVTEAADARAEVLAALQLTNDQALDFGSLIVNNGSTGGDVVVDATGARTCSGDVICGPLGAEQQALFTVTGAANTTVAISLEDVAANGTTLTHTGNVGSTAANHNIELVALTDSAAGGFASFSGNEQFGVGGTIQLDGTEIAGTYLGSFNVTVEYQ
ncbi:DUF4402 domain-containing protein [Erythrobacter sp. SCSIO 43205]|uniref:DUF4402 domain-containing protein n=1 Tax=Erythrobacter sp. SCSIO 43205 TaxID=2779361 RepID=UPI001CA84F5D|nr:DUF4402 domain-containing protein [Erythrobacter sp. SCSIO 43205]UAB78479.1 DUF4402 domain-containing protein [Erythrobacter sp. SCSIO 43205]